MTIRLKVIVLIAAIFAVLGLTEIVVERQVMLPSFAELERADARTAMRRIEYAFDLALDRVGLAAVDWGNWADVYRFMQDRNASVVNEDITVSAMHDLRINLVLLVDRDGNVVLAREADLKSNRMAGFDLGALHKLPADFPWTAQLRDGRAAQGFIRTRDGIVMLAAGPVLDGFGRGPSRGLLIMGRLLTDDVVKGISAQAQASLAMLAAVPGAPAQMLRETDQLTQVYRSFNDLYGTPLFQVRVDVPREISRRGHAAVSYASLCLVAAAVVMLILVLAVVSRVILNPLATVTRHAVALGEDKDLTTRLNLRRGDEIGVLAREFDRMVERVAHSRTQLVDQSYQAGFAELAKGVLHNLGNAMTPISVRLARLAERLRAAPAEDAQQAVAELAQGRADAQRGADLEQFLRLACQELALTVTAAREDVAVASRQAGVVQTTLAEQMRTTRNEHVIEPVRLTELLTQSLEIVPDACRARLSVHADDTLRRLGVVRIARTVLRLVLQNLIINAADAVRDAGKERGALRVSAELLADTQQLHLLCQDDGVGIPPQHLERVFEKGFSTKSPETNHGIGLHWCANAIGALGGRIWAASDGPGRGACLHLLVPLAARETTSLAGAA